jgi:hypothetical protein
MCAPSYRTPVANNGSDASTPCTVIEETIVAVRMDPPR